MSRQGLALIAFGLGIVVAPLGWVLTINITTPAVAQEGGTEDLIDIQPGERQSKDLKYKLSQERLVEEQPADDQPNPVAIYLNLAKQKAELLTPDELAHETQVLRQELLELQATLKLRKAQQQLQQLIDEHPESVAAQKAKMLLEVLGSQIHLTPNYGSPSMTPTPDDAFESITQDTFAPGPQRRRTPAVDPKHHDADNFNKRINDNDPFDAPADRKKPPPPQPTKKPAPSFSPNRS